MVLCQRSKLEYHNIFLILNQIQHLVQKYDKSLLYNIDQSKHLTYQYKLKDHERFLTNQIKSKPQFIFKIKSLYATLFQLNILTNSIRISLKRFSKSQFGRSSFKMCIKQTLFNCSRNQIELPKSISYTHSDKK